MSSKIEWTDETLNPIKARRKDTGKVGWHCEKCSPACEHCYACVFNMRSLPNGGTGLDYTVLSRDKVEIFLDIDVFIKAARWKRPRKIFVCSMTDLFADFVPYWMIYEVWGFMARHPRHTFQILTKRADRMAEIVAKLALIFGVLPNVWLGVTAENQTWLKRRADKLVSTPAAVRYISYEPALGAISIADYVSPDYSHPPLIDWVIAGGESGTNARLSHPDWFRSIQKQCEVAKIPFFFKQWGEFLPATDADSEGLWPCECGHPENAHDLNGDKPGIPLHCFHEGCDCTEFRNHNMKRRARSIAGVTLIKIGKKLAGAKLDGAEFKQFPEAS